MARLFTESALYDYISDLATPKAWFKANVDRVLGIYHVNVVYTGPGAPVRHRYKPMRFDFLHVCCCVSVTEAVGPQTTFRKASPGRELLLRYSELHPEALNSSPFWHECVIFVSS